MSLVNDMLRDLDQRRKESDGPAARIKLTPAGDYPRQERRNLVPAIAATLIVIAGVLAYTWVNMNSGQTTQQLSAPIVTVATTPAGIEEPRSEIDDVPAAQDSAQVVAAAPVPVAPSTVESDIAVVESLDELLARSSDNLTDTSATSASPSATTTASNQLAVNSTSTTTSGSNTPDSTASGTSAGSTINVRSQSSTTAPAEQIKDVTEPSPELRDTLVVQESLRLIANNETTAAYTKLEQHLIDNPYAHQSRETYAKFLMNQGDAASANALVTSGLELAPNHSGFKKVKARLLISGGDIKSAVSLLESRAPAVRDDGEYHEILASAQLAVRDYEGAALSYTSLIQMDQTQGRWWYGFAAAQDALGNDTAAQQAYTRAMEKPNLSASLRRRSQDRLIALGR